METQICKACRREKSISEFYFQPYRSGQKSGVHVARCRQCQNERCQRLKRLRLLGLSHETFEALLLLQDNRCQICLREFTVEDPLCVDHDHETMEVRGLLHSNCNRAIGLLRDDPISCQRAADYLKRDIAAVFLTYEDAGVSDV